MRVSSIEGERGNERERDARARASCDHRPRIDLESSEVDSARARDAIDGDEDAKDGDDDDHDDDDDECARETWTNGGEWTSGPRGRAGARRGGRGVGGEGDDGGAR